MKGDSPEGCKPYKRTSKHGEVLDMLSVCLRAILCAQGCG
jgi:hypothetical protein